MTELLSLLGNNEPTISAIVGLLTLFAMLWGVVQLALLPLITARREAPAADTASPAAVEFRLWRALIDRGVAPDSDLELQVMARTFNACALMIIVLALGALASALLSRGVLLMSALNFATFIAAVAAYNLHFRGYARSARWLLLVTVATLWSLSLALMGTGVGVEYCFAGVLALPLLLFGKQHVRESRAAIGGLLLLFPVTLWIAVVIDNPPSTAYTDIAVNYYYVNAVFLAFVMALILNAYNRAADESFRLLEDQKARAEELINRTLPAYVAEKVATDDIVVADWHSEASVLVATVHGFESLYQRVSAVQLVEILGQVFREFDELAEGLGVEKVNTLGTNYIAATGIDPARSARHADVARLALGMGAVVARLSRTAHHEFTLSAGLSTGDVVSGVIGRSRPSFDIWGRTVETADTLREPGAGPSIVVNEAAFWRLREDFDFEEVAGGEPRFRLLGEKAGQATATAQPPE